MFDAFGIMNLLNSTVVMRSLCDFTLQTGVFGDVDVVLVFCFYESSGMGRLVGSITAALEAMQTSNLELHVANETLNFTDDYDGERTYTGLQRENLIARISEKLDAISYQTFTI